MGSGMFAHLIPDAAHWVTGGLIPGPGGGKQVGVNGSAYAGVAPSLAGANAGYGGAVQPGANQYAAASGVNPYSYAASQATKSTGS